MPDWRESHFNVPGKPTAPPRRRWWLLVLIALPVPVIGGLYLAQRAELVDTTTWWRGASVITPDAAPETDPTRARLLRERVVSQERGIALMSRERVEVERDLTLQKRLLDEAVARIRQLESASAAGLSSSQIADARVAHANAVAQAKNATTRSKELTSRRESLDRRIATAERERDAALSELGQKVVAEE